MHQERIANIITQLKKVREENGLSYAKIQEMVEANGDYVSKSTIQRVFAEGSEEYGYQFENTLKPIATAVLGINSETEVATVSEVDALKAIIAYKSERIAELEEQINHIGESYRRRLDFLKDQINLKDARIDRRDDMLERILKEKNDLIERLLKIIYKENDV